MLISAYKAASSSSIQGLIDNNRKELRNSMASLLNLTQTSLEILCISISLILNITLPHFSPLKSEARRASKLKRTEGEEGKSIAEQEE